MKFVLAGLMSILVCGCSPADNLQSQDKDRGLNGPNKPSIGQCRDNTQLGLPINKTQNEFNFELFIDNNNVPHIRANSLEEISFASGFVFAQNNYCMFQKQILLMSGESAKYFGPHKFSDSDDVKSGDMFYLINDLFVKNFQFLRKAKFVFPKLSKSTQVSFNSYAEGINSFEKLNNIDCNFKKQLSGADIYAYFLYKSSIKNHKNIFIEMIKPHLSFQAVKLWQNSLKTDANAFAFGKEVTDSNTNSSLFTSTYALYDTDFKQFELHIIIPNQLNVYGVTEYGFPFPQIGFNDKVAWTHTPNKNAINYLLYELETRGNFYIYNNQPYVIDNTLLEVSYKTFGGGFDKWSVVIPSTHLGWAYKNNNKMYAFKENLTSNTDMVDHWLSLALAKSVNDIKQSHQYLRGIPDKFTIAIDKYGRSIKIDSSRAFKLSSDAQAALTNNTLVAQEDNLPNKSVCAQSVTDFSDIPVEKSRKSLWSVGHSFNPGNQKKYMATYGYYNSKPSKRLFAAKTIIDQDNHWDSLKAYNKLFLNNLSFVFLNEKSKIYSACLDLMKSKRISKNDCNQLIKWNGQFDGENKIETVVAEVFSHKLNYRVSYNPANPISTPNNLIVDDNFKNSLLNAFKIYKNNDFKTPLKQQDQDYSISGGESKYGVINQASYKPTAFMKSPTMDLMTDSGLVKGLDGKMYYPVNYGASWIMTVDFKNNKPKARGLLVYGNKSNSLDEKQMNLYQTQRLRPLERFSNNEFSMHKFKKFSISTN